jgi:hypothetical protein
MRGLNRLTARTNFLIDGEGLSAEAIERLSLEEMDAVIAEEIAANGVQAAADKFGLDLDEGPVPEDPAAAAEYLLTGGQLNPQREAAAPVEEAPTTVRVTSPDGRVGTIPIGNLEAAQAAGFTVAE